MLVSRRLRVFLAVTFLVTWTCWGILVPLARARTALYGQFSFMLLYMLGGAGPTLAAYVAVLTTRSQSPLTEFHSRLCRWRGTAWWCAVALALPVAVAVAPAIGAIVVHPDFLRVIPVRPWYLLVLLFFKMVVGGGLEELGWRGIAQPEMERPINRPVAAVLVGLIWALWHLPLFVLPGVAQYGTNFPVFAVGVVGNAMMLAWLYGRTESILLCIVFHATLNVVATLGLAIPADPHSQSVLDACLRVVVGALLLAVDAALPKRASR
jgi:uncharacterized protein